VLFSRFFIFGPFSSASLVVTFPLGGCLGGFLDPRRRRLFGACYILFLSPFFFLETKHFFLPPDRSGEAFPDSISISQLGFSHDK